MAPSSQPIHGFATVKAESKLKEKWELPLLRTKHTLTLKI